jgi:hypothetical protein
MLCSSDELRTDKVTILMVIQEFVLASLFYSKFLNILEATWTFPVTRFVCEEQGNPLFIFCTYIAVVSSKHESFAGL